MLWFLIAITLKEFLGITAATNLLQIGFNFKGVEFYLFFRKVKISWKPKFCTKTEISRDNSYIFCSLFAHEILYLVQLFPVICRTVCRLECTSYSGFWLSSLTKAVSENICRRQRFSKLVECNSLRFACLKYFYLFYVI